MKKFLEKLVEPKYLLTAIVFVFAYGFIFWKLSLLDVLSNTTVTGGDTGTHVYIVDYLAKIFPHVKGWSPDWYSGFPFLYFYPPLVYFLTVVLSFVIPLNIAFKVMIFLCILIYPLAFYWTLKNLHLPFPTPQIGVVLSLFLIFYEKYSIYGGNLNSLLAGQFSHTVSIPLLFLFLATFWRGAKNESLLRTNVLLGAATILTHPTSGLLLILAGLFLPLTGESIKKTFVYMIKVYLGIFLLSAFFTLGMVWYREYMGSMNWTLFVKPEEIFAPYWYPIHFFAILGILFMLAHRRLALAPIFITFTVSLLAYATLNNSEVWNTRFLPYVLFAFLIFAAYGIGELLNLYNQKYKELLLSLGVIVIILPLTFIGVNENIKFGPSWFRWNNEGYQGKAKWWEVQGLFDYLKGLPRGRVLWEYSADYGNYGTPRVLELVPTFGKQPTFEGLLIESGLTSSFHFINQAETSESPTSAVAGFDYPPFDFAKGMEHLRLSGGRYFIAYSQKVRTEAAASPELRFLKKIEQFEVYELLDSSLVQVVEGISIKEKGENWQPLSRNWYLKGNLKRPIVFLTNKERKSFPKTSEPAGEVEINLLEENTERIRFTTNSPGVPHLVKISYFPTWKATGAKGPYLVSPAYMMVVPQQNEVTLEFKNGLVDTAGYVFLGLGVIYLFLLKPKRANC